MKILSWCCLLLVSWRMGVPCGSGWVQLLVGWNLVLSRQDRRSFELDKQAKKVCKSVLAVISSPQLNFCSLVAWASISRLGSLTESVLLCHLEHIWTRVCPGLDLYLSQRISRRCICTSFAYPNALFWYLFAFTNNGSCAWLSLVADLYNVRSRTHSRSGPDDKSWDLI